MGKNISLFLFSLIGINLLGFSQRTIKVQDNKILSACNEEIVMRGVNEMFVWSSDKKGSTTLPEIAKTGANTVRLVWTTTDGTVADLDALIQNCLAQNMIPVPELHDATGDFSQLQKLLDYWKKPEVLQMIQKYKQWIIVNIGNEIGAGSETNDQWEAYYKDAITQLRTAGIDVPLMIDCGEYGSNEKYFLAKGNALLDHDPLHNIIFSVHTYWINPDSDQGRMDRLDSLISQAKRKNLPFVIGEGPQMAASPWSTYCGVVFPYQYLLKRCQEENIGWLSWSWGLADNNDCGAPNSVFDITTNGKFGSWATDFAEEIMMTDVNSINKTSIIPASMTSDGCGKNCSPVHINATKTDICENGPVKLEIDSSNLTSKTISWYFNNTLLETKEGASIIANEKGNYRIELDSANACQVFDDVVITKNLAISAGNDKIICETSTVDIDLQGVLPQYRIDWYINGNNEASLSGKQSASISQVGTYVIQMYNDFCESIDTVEVKSKLPMITDTTICINTSETLHVQGNGNYVWYDNANLSNNIYEGAHFVVNQNTAKTYFVRDEGGFSGNVGKEDLGESVWTTWDAESMENKLGFEVFKTLTVSSFDVYAEKAGKMNVVFYDKDLTAIKTLPFTVKGGKNTLDINESFTPGIYYADVAGSAVNLQFNHDEGPNTTSFPYVLNQDDEKVLSIDKSSPDWIVTKPWYLFFYNWTVNISSGASCIAKEILVDVDQNCLLTTTELSNVINAFHPNPFTDVISLNKVSKYKIVTTNGIEILKGEGQTINTKSLKAGTYFLHIEGVSYKIQKD